MKRVLLTGASGFIGRFAVSELLKNNYEVHALYHKSKPVEKKHVIYHKADLFDFSQQESLIREIKPTHLLHLAWYAVPGLYWNSLENFRWVQASLELLKLFRQYDGQRAVLAGTCAEYDWSFGYCSESVTPTNPSTLYGTCKNSLQEMIAQFSKQTGLSSAWGRIFYLYGPFEDRSRLIPYVVNSLLQDEQANCTHGHQIRDFLYVQDVASAFVALLNSRVEGPINIASGQPVSLQQVVYSIADKLERRDMVRLGSIPVFDNEPPLIVADIRRLTNEVGWKQKFNLDSGLKQTIQWWKDNSWD
ncbi:MAG: NAD(P)-dependent oxidoreductase [Candidatus Methanoperedens sp.]